jgi:hypothetical protein
MNNKKGIKYDDSPYVPLLGKMPDSKLAESFNVSTGYIRQLRVKYNIPKFFNQEEHTKFKQEYVSLLGTMSDVKLAQKLNMSKSRIHQLRVKHNIPKHKPMTVKERQEIAYKRWCELITQEELTEQEHEELKHLHVLFNSTYGL